MQTVTMLVWEFWARSWRDLAWAWLGSLAIGSLVYGALLWQLPAGLKDSQWRHGMQFVFSMLAIVAIGGALVPGLREYRRRFTLPLSSLTIVGSTMAGAMVSVFLLYVALALSINAAFGAGWYILGPALLAALLVAWLQTLIWSISNSPTLTIAGTIANLATLMGGLVWLESTGRLEQAAFLTGPASTQIPLFGAGAMVCLGLCTVGYSRLRRGDGFEPDRVIIAWVGRVWPQTARATPFPTSSAAQVWMETRSRGFILPIITAVIGFATIPAVLIVGFMDVVHPGDGVDFIGGATAMLGTPILVVGIYLGGRSDHGGFGSFNGSRPVPDRQIATAILTSTTRRLVSAALIWGLFMAAALLIIERDLNFWQLFNIWRVAESMDRIGLTELLVLGSFCGLCIWSGVCLVTSVSLGGKNVITVGFASVITTFIAGGIIGEFVVPRELKDTFGEIYYGSLMVIIAVGIVAAFITDLRLRLIGPRTLWLAAGLALVTAVAASYLAALEGDDNLATVAAILWAAIVIPAPLAAAPLAVWWNRHR